MLTPKVTDASHAIGGEISYECVGNDRYVVHVTFFFDCSSTFTNWEIELGIESDCGMSTTVPLNLLDAEPHVPPFDAVAVPYEVPIYCQPSNCDPNGNGNYPGMLQYPFISDTLNLSPCNGYTFSLTENARSEAIQTITGPGTEDIYVEAFLNNLDAPCNSSPRFDDAVDNLLCLNESKSSIHTATDFDGDMLVYSLYTPLTGPGPGDIVNYIGGYGVNNPVSNSSFSFSGGVLEVTATQLEVGVMGVMVEEYRDGVLIGSIMRDFQVTVSNQCPISPSGYFQSDTLAGFDADSSVVCVPDSIEFDVVMGNLQSGLNYYLYVDNLEDFPGATFDVQPAPNNPDSLIGHFAWLPDLNNNTSDQTIIIKAYNDACPVPGNSTFIYRIVYHDIVVEPWLGLVGVACNDSVEIIPYLAPYGEVQYEWQNGDTTETFWATPGNYSVSVIDELGCSGTDSYEVYVNNYPVADFTVEDFCLNESIQIQDLSVNFAESGVTPLNLTNWTWDFGDGSDVSTDQSPTHTYSEAGDYTISLTLENENDCSDYTEVIVTVDPLTDFDAKATVACIGSETDFVNNSQPQSGSVVSWDWDLGHAGSTSTQAEPVYTYPDVGVYDVTLTATTDKGCVNDTMIEAIVAAEAVAAFTDSVSPNCGEENLVIFFKNESENATSYLWDFGSSTDTSTDPVYSTPDEYGPIVKLVAYAVAGEAACSDTLVDSLDHIFLVVDFDTMNAGNVITPNGDNINDCLAPFWDEGYQECYRLRIWDRWGMFIYDSDDVTDGYCWPGTDRKGQPVSNGTFFYVAEVNNYSRGGSVMVTR